MARKTKQPRRRVPGSAWRVAVGGGARDVAHVTLSSEAYGGRVVFDELVIDDWLHLEQMSEDEWWMRVGDVKINVAIGRDGKPRVMVERDGG